MNNSIKVNNQMVAKILEAIDKDRGRYPEFWEIISGKEFDEKAYKNNSEKDPKIKFIGNLDFLNLKKIENSKLLSELAERIKRGEIKLNVFDCCYLMQCFGFIRKNIEETNDEKSRENKQLDSSQIQIKDLNLFVMMILHLLKKDGLLCPNHNKLMEEVEKKEVEELKKEKK